MEMKLTNVARASLEELRLDYEDFLRQRNLSIWDQSDPRRAALIDRRCTTADQVAQWVQQVHEGSGQHGQSGPPQPSTKSTQSTYPEIAANAALTLVSAVRLPQTCPP